MAAGDSANDLTIVEAEETNVVRLAVGAPEEPFADPWRFWTSGDSAYLSIRTLGGFLKASFHPADERHATPAWLSGFTKESGAVIDGMKGRHSHHWPLGLEDPPGWYGGPVIVVPRFVGRKYDMPPTLSDFSDVRWVPAPDAGSVRILNVLLTDDRSDLPPLELPPGERVIAVLKMTNGWQLAIHTTERPLKGDDLMYGKQELEKLRVGINVPPLSGQIHASLLWATTNPDGRPCFVHIVVDSDNFYEEPRTQA